MKFDLIYENIMNEIANSEKILTEGIFNKVGSMITAGTLAAGAMLAPTDTIADEKPITITQQATINHDIGAVINLAIDKIKQFEGAIKDANGNLIAYDDANNKRHWNGVENINSFIKSCKGRPTIGYGETDSDIVKLGKISNSTAERLLKNKIKKIDGFLVRKFKKAYLGLNINQKVALISFYYNLGVNFKAPKMERALRAGNIRKAAYEMLDCDNITVNGKLVKVDGLTKRRQAEHDMMISNI